MTTIKSHSSKLVDIHCSKMQPSDICRLIKFNLFSSVELEKVTLMKFSGFFCRRKRSKMNKKGNLAHQVFLDAAGADVIVAAVCSRCDPYYLYFCLYLYLLFVFAMCSHCNPSNLVFAHVNPEVFGAPPRFDFFTDLLLNVPVLFLAEVTFPWVVVFGAFHQNHDMTFFAQWFCLNIGC